MRKSQVKINLCIEILCKIDYLRYVPKMQTHYFDIEILGFHIGILKIVEE